MALVYSCSTGYSTVASKVLKTVVTVCRDLNNSLRDFATHNWPGLLIRGEWAARDEAYKKAS
jgi:hypothetical protein